MAEYATLPSNFKLHWQRTHAKGIRFKPQKSLSKNFPRHYKFGPVSLRSVCKHSVTSVSTHNVRTSASGRSSLRRNCLGTMIDFESAAASDWVPVVDQVLLTASVFLTYVAGVIPSGRSYRNSRSNNSSDVQLPESPIYCGSTKEKEDQVSSQCTWDIVKGKIIDSLLAVENGDIMENNSVEFEKDRAKRPLSLYAIANGPRFRLLLSSIEQLEKEVNEISNTSEVVERDGWLGLFSTAIKKACQSACTSWMEKELWAENCRDDKVLLFSIAEKFKGEDLILGNIQKSGKMDLYADLIGFLRYGYFRKFSYYDHNIYSLHGGHILEDLVITVADAIVSMYLELTSVDSAISEKMGMGLSLCTLSTRALQKLRNEVAMCQWIHQNFGEIVLMYEDRFDLWVLDIEPCQDPSKKHKADHSWWRRLSVGRSMTMQPSIRYAVVSHFSLTLKRTRELRALKGWRYYSSLLLELADIVMPMVKAVVTHFRNAISFFLVSLIGRSLGLIYTGIRKSLRWKS